MWQESDGQSTFRSGASTCTNNETRAVGNESRSVQPITGPAEWRTFHSNQPRAVEMAQLSPPERVRADDYHVKATTSDDPVNHYVLSDEGTTDTKAINPRIKVQWFALLLTSAFFFLSGLDGMLYCVGDLGSSGSSTNSNDISSTSQCVSTFACKIMPSAMITSICSILALFELFSKEHHSKVSVHLVGMPAVVSMVAWVYALVSIMLMSHRYGSSYTSDVDYDTWVDNGNTAANNEESSTQEEQSLFFFQSPSLASSLYAINELGEIGINANLYHATWMSFFLSISLAHRYLYPLLLLTCCKSYLFWKKHKLRKKFYFRHRERIGSWMAILLASLVVLASSSLIWESVLHDECSYAIMNLWEWEETIAESTEDDEDDDDYFTKWDDAGDDDSSSGSVKIPILAIHPRICSSAELAMMMGMVGAAVALVTMAIHSSSHRMGTFGDPLKPSMSLLCLETFLCFIMVVLYGFGSMFLTGSYQGGLAQNVGNLYYATWVVFIFSVRVFIGCIEEILTEDHDSIGTVPVTTADEEKNRCGSSKVATCSEQLEKDFASGEILPYKEEFEDHQDLDRSASDERVPAIKRWSAIALFSAICHGAAYDAAEQYYYTKFGDFDDNVIVIVTLYQKISPAQRWTLTCPFIVMILSIAIVLLHLRAMTYSVFSRTPKIGLLFSIVVFLMCISQIIIAQHSKNSFAVNHLGEVIAANLYYFTWASVVTAGMNFGTYLQKTFGFKSKSLSFGLWFGMVKVGIIIMGSASHVWLELKDSCQENGGGANGDTEEGVLGSMCWRTKYSVIAGTTGTVLAVVVCGCLLLHWRYSVIVQCFISALLVIMFVIGTGAITGMGGPAESVGDLYYSTWLAFGVSLFLAADSIGQLKTLPTTTSNEPSEDEQITSFGKKYFVDPEAPVSTPFVAIT